MAKFILIIAILSLNLFGEMTPPKVNTYYSKNKKFWIQTVPSTYFPNNVAKKSSCNFFSIVDGDTIVKKFHLVNPLAPALAKVSDDGIYIITQFDLRTSSILTKDRHYSPRALVIYTSNGDIISDFSLTDFEGCKYIPSGLKIRRFPRAYFGNDGFLYFSSEAPIKVELKTGEYKKVTVKDCNYLLKLNLEPLNEYIPLWIKYLSKDN